MLNEGEKCRKSTYSHLYSSFIFLSKLIYKSKIIKSFSQVIERSYNLYFRTRQPLKIILLSFLSSKQQI